MPSNQNRRQPKRKAREYDTVQEAQKAEVKQLPADGQRIIKGGK